MVQHRVVAEYISVVSAYPNVPFGVDAQSVQVRELLDVLVVSRELVVGEVFSVIAVDAFLSQKPHVSFGVFFYGDDFSTA